MCPYKITELFQKYGFKSKPPKKPENTPLSGFYLSFFRTSACRRPETGRSAFAAARQSRGFSGGLRLICSDFTYARLHWRQHVAVGRGQSPFASGSASWASLADCVSSAQASTSSRLPSRDLRFRLRFARRHRVSLATYSSIDSSFANARFHRSYIFRRRQHVAVPKPTALPSLPLGNRGVSLADCVSSAQASTSSRFRRRQHVSTCLVIGKLS